LISDKVISALPVLVKELGEDVREGLKGQNHQFPTTVI